MSKIKNHPLFQKLLSLNLFVEDFAVFGGGPMFAHGIKWTGHDLDIIARGKAWEQASKMGEVKKAKLGKGSVVELFDGTVEIFNDWSPGLWDINELINAAEYIEGIKFVTLENVIKYKKIYNRPKDLEQIKLIEEFFAKQRKTTP